MFAASSFRQNMFADGQFSAEYQGEAELKSIERAEDSTFSKPKKVAHLHFAYGTQALYHR